MNTRIAGSGLNTILSTAAALCLTTGIASAGIIFEVDFDSGVTVGETSTTINGVIGGTATISTKDGATVTVETTSNMGKGGYLRVVNQTLGQELLGMRIFPADDASSLAALAKQENGIWMINGGFDVFFRNTASATTGISVFNSSAGGGEFEMIDFGSGTGSKSSLRILAGNMSATSDWGLTLIGYADAFGPGVDRIILEADSAFQIEDGKVYHLGVTFNTDANGVTTMRLFGKEGTGAIDTSATTDLLASVTFNVDESVMTGGIFPTESSKYYTNSPFILGTRNGVDRAKTQDFDRFRLYDADPGTFEALPEPAALLPVMLGGLLWRRRRQ